MHDLATDAPTGALIDHNRTCYHDTHRRELPEPIALARQVETAHATNPNTPYDPLHLPKRIGRLRMVVVCRPAGRRIFHRAGGQTHAGLIVPPHSDRKHYR